MAIAHTKNRLPSRAIKGQIPFEILTGRKAKLEHLRVLGCDAYALHKAPGRNKLQEKADHYLLVGYGDTTGTYKVYDPKKRTILITRDVVFNEEGFIRRRYLPYQDHFGMGDDIEGDDLIPPANNHPSSRDLLPDDAEDDDDDDDDDGHPHHPPPPPARDMPDSPNPAVKDEHQSEAGPSQPRQQTPPPRPVPRIKVPKLKSRKVPVRPPTPPTPTPQRDAEQPESPDPLLL